MIPEKERLSREEYLSKPLPSSPDSERVILGAILLNNEVIGQVITLGLTVNHFYSPSHRKIFTAMVGLFESGNNIDPVLIGQEIKKTGSLEQLGGIAAITNLTLGLPHFTKVEDYVRIVKEKATTRDFIKQCSASISEALQEEEDISETIEHHEQKVYELKDISRTKGFVPLSEVVKKSLSKVREMAKHSQDGQQILGLSTGFRRLNEKISGLQKTDLIIVAGRSSMGKTALALDIALNATDDDKEAVVGVFTIEMADEQYANRLICQKAMVDSQRYRTGYLTRDEWNKVAIASGECPEKRIFIDDSSSLNPLELRTKARRLASEKKRLDLIIVDYLQLMNGGGRFESREKEVAYISRQLKQIAKDFCVPVIALSQLSRAPEARNPPRPMMSDLRESGGIENDADVVLLVYRASYYERQRTAENEGIAEIIIGKNRNGPAGVSVKLAYLDFCSHFANLNEDIM